jgi:flagellar hook assembly protein FlgD
VQRAIVLDVAGRRVRTLPTPATGTMLAQWDWDLRDDAGARVPPGLYLVSVRTALGSVSRSVLVVP